MVQQYKEIIKKYFERHSIVESNIQSFNKFMDEEMQKIVDETNEIIPTIIPSEVKDFKIKLGKIKVEKPNIVEADGSKRNIFPMEARLRNLTYSTPIYLSVSTFIDGVERESFNALVGKMPVMLKSKYCHLHGLEKQSLADVYEDPYDPGGYFILNGNERVLITVEDLASNRLFIEKPKTGPSKYIARIFSEKGSYRIPHTVEQMKNGIIYLSFTRFKRIPITAIIKALGIAVDQNIANFISKEKTYDDIFINLYETNELKTQEDALEFIGKKIGITQSREEKIERASELLDRYLLPHLGVNKEDRMAKAHNLCKFIKRFLMVVREGASLRDKDHYMDKRLKLSGDLLSDLFRVNLRSLVQDMLYNFQRLVKRGKFQSIRIIIRDQLLTSRIKSAMATGSWVGGRKGISQNIDRTNYLATVSHLQRVVSLLSTSQENFDARALHSTHWGRLCLDKNTNVLLADNYTNRTLEMLQNCWHHHKVATFNTKNKTLVSSAISNYHTSNPKLLGKKTYKLTTESGREVIATEDHPFYTQNGWRDASNLELNSKVAVYPSLDTVQVSDLPNNNLGITIVAEEDIINNSPKRFKHYIKELERNELLPFTANNYKTEIIARLLGHIFSDGHCGKYNLEFYCGSNEDALRISEDIKLLGFKPSKISKKQSKINFEGRTTNYTTYILTKGGALRSLLVCAGAPVGRKTDTNISVPKWILNSSQSVKREFLATLLGGDGPKPRAVIRKDRKSGSKIQIDSIILHKENTKKDNIKKFAEDLKTLFKEFDVKISKITIKEDYERKDRKVMLKCSIVFGKSQNNIKNILTKIGYRYCLQKEKEAMFIGEWLRIRDNSIKQRMDLKNEVKKLHADGIKPRKISSLLNLNYRVVQGWLFESQKYEKTRLSQNMLLSYEKWLEKSRIKNSIAVWEKITNKSEQDINDVRDFTTIENTHSFIANGFITHNCPVETPEGTPIGLRKNMAITTKITQESVPDNKIKKILESCGLENG